MSNTSEIIAIEMLDENEMIDIEVSGDHYFYANGILTHNSNSDPGMEDVSESFGLAMTADMMLALMVSEELRELGQILCKQLKNRFGDISNHNKFVLGVNRSMFKLYDVEQKTVTAMDGGDESPQRLQSKQPIDRKKFAILS